MLGGRYHSKKISWNRAFLIALLVLLALLLIFSRGYRAARRAIIPTDTATDTSRVEESPKVYEPKIRDEMREETGNMEYDISRDMLLGRIDPAGDPDFVVVNPEYAVREGMYMRKAAYSAFVNMRDSAISEGVELSIISAARTFGHQKRIWENKWEGRQQLHGGIYATDIDDPLSRAEEILRFSAMPGTSRHHWGTDIDLNSLQNSYFESGPGKAVYDWLIENAAGFDFCQPYTAHGNNREGGYEEEKWHWSYLPLASAFTEAFKELVSYDDITGFAGQETARQLEVIENYVLDVNLDCQ